MHGAMIDGRGSGRTKRALAALPDGAFYLVRHEPMARYCRDLLVHLGRRRDAIRFVTPDLTHRAICGVRPRAWDVDHDVRISGRAAEAFDLLWMAAGAGPGTATASCQPQGS